MKMTEAVKSVLSQYVGFKGRARRSEYWWWVLAYAIIAFVVYLVVELIANQDAAEMAGNILGLLVFLPNLAVQIRRLHDTGKSGWWWLITLTGIGIIVLIVWYCKDSQAGENQYGPSPKG